jgi:hypothetical protein
MSRSSWQELFPLRRAQGLDLTLSADKQSPPPQAVVVDLVGSGGIRRTYAGKFPPDSATLLRLQYPNLPAGISTFSVQTLDADGCVVGESPTPFDVAIKAGAKVTAMTSVRRSTVPCGDGGVPVFDSGADVALSVDLGGADVATVSADAPMDTAPAVDLPPSIDAAPAPSSLDVAATEAISVDLAPALTSLDAGADAPLPAAPTIISFTVLMPTIASGTLTQLTAVFSGGTGSIDNDLGPATSGVPVPTGVLSSSTTYTLTVTNPAGDTATRQVTVTASTAVGPGLFTSTGSMLVARSEHTATLLPNGKVLIAGGDHSAATIPSNAELYDPDSGAFSSTQPMSTTRVGHTATLLPNGKVLVAGGWGKSAPLFSAELYDPATGNFALTGSMVEGRYEHAAVPLADGAVLLMGGQGTNGTLATAEVYDPSTGRFASTGSMTAARQFFAAVALADSKVVVCGGEDLVGVVNPILAEAEVFDPTVGRFTSTKPLNIPRIWHTATWLRSGQILVVGGGNNSETVNLAELYDPTTGGFSMTGATSDARCLHSGALLPNGKVLVAGGHSYSDTDMSGTTLSSAELFDPNAGHFLPAGSMTTPRERHTATLLPTGKVLVASGTTAELYW